MAQQHLNHHIAVAADGTTKVTNTFSGGTNPTNIQLQPGDKVTFTSDNPDTEILYKEFDPLPPKTQSGSPFEPDLKAGDRHKVSLATEFTVHRPCDFNAHFVFACGRDMGGVFSAWSSTGKPGGSTPGPDA
jgi:hypothetical protein